MVDAASIINSAASRPRIDVRGVERRARDPFRTIVVVLMGIPPCDRYPQGTQLWVQPRQVEQHKRLFPGAYVIKELRKRVRRGAKDLGVTPTGHVQPGDLAPGTLRRRGA